MVERVLPLNISSDFHGYKRASTNEIMNDWTMKTTTSEGASMNLTSRTIVDQTPTKGRMIQTHLMERSPRPVITRQPTGSDYGYEPESPMVRQQNVVTIQSSNVTSKCQTSVAGPRLTDLK